MSRKGKLSAEKKEKIVKDYLDGKASSTSITQDYGIHHSTLGDWVDIYQAEGAGGLITHSRNKIYTKEEKLQAVEEYLDGKGSLNKICRKRHIRSNSMLRGWIKKYNGHEELKTSASGGEIYMTKGRKTSFEERVEIISFCIENGDDYKKTINKYSVSYQQIYNWIKKYKEQGAEGLADLRGKRKPEALMTDFERLQVENRLLEAEIQRLRMENDLLKKLEEIERRRF